MDPISIPDTDRRTSILFGGVSLAIVLLFALVPIPRPNAVSSMPWKVEVVSAIFLAVGAIAIGRRAKISHFKHLLIAISIFVVWSALSVLWARSYSWTMHHTLVWGAYIGFLWLFDRWIEAGIGRRSIILAFGTISVGLAMMMILDLSTSPDFGTFSGGAFRIRYGKFAELLTTITPILLATAFYSRRKLHIFATTSLWLLGWLGVMLSLSRGAFLAGIAAHLLAFAGLLIAGQKRRTLKFVVLWLGFTVAIQFGLSAATTTPTTADFLSGAQDQTRSTATFRIFAWSLAGQMAADHWLVGVGADNFGITVSETRAVIAAKHPDDRTPTQAEDYLVERAHNEPIQILDELGSVGLAIFLASGLLIVYKIGQALRARRFRMSPMFWGSLAGVIAFLGSSMVSSFSFRAIQNGIAFFAVLALLLREISKASPRSAECPVRYWRYVSLAFGILLIVFAGVKGIGEFSLYQVERAANENDARRLFERSLRLDPDNAQAWFAYGAFESKTDPHKAADLTRTAIDRGLGTTLTYSRLADHLSDANDLKNERQVFEKGLSIFPNSVFLLVRYAHFLNQNGDAANAQKQMAMAVSIDSRQARGWDAILSHGSVSAFYLAQSDPGIAPPDDLLPKSVIYLYLDDPNP